MKHFWDYLQERFPLQTNGVLILSYFAANYLLAHASTWNQEPIHLTWRFAAGCIVLLLMFFHLRVIDEHKDYERDLPVYPERMLSRGLITLKELRIAGSISISLELVLSYSLGWPAFSMCLLLLILSWLIYKEFFMPGFLDKHLLVNAFLHLLVMPVYSLFVFSITTSELPWDAPVPMLFYAWVSYGVGLSYELARKTRAPKDERAGLLTYSAVMGPYPPAYGVLMALIFSGWFSALVGIQMDFSIWYHLLVAGSLFIVAAGVLHFRINTTTRTAARLPIIAGLFIFAFDWLLVIEILRQNGLVFS